MADYSTSFHMHKQPSVHVNMHPQTCMHTYMPPHTQKWKNKHSSMTTSETMASLSSTSHEAYRTHTSSLSDLHTASLFCLNSAEVSPLLTEGELALFASSGYLCQLPRVLCFPRHAGIAQVTPSNRLSLSPHFTSILFVFLSPRIDPRSLFCCC